MLMIVPWCSSPFYNTLVKRFANAAIEFNLKNSTKKGKYHAVIKFLKRNISAKHYFYH